MFHIAVIIIAIALLPVAIEVFSSLFAHIFSGVVKLVLLTVILFFGFTFFQIIKDNFVITIIFLCLALVVFTAYAYKRHAYNYINQWSLFSSQPLQFINKLSMLLILSIRICFLLSPPIFLYANYKIYGLGNIDEPQVIVGILSIIIGYIGWKSLYEMINHSNEMVLSKEIKFENISNDGVYEFKFIKCNNCGKTNRVEMKRLSGDTSIRGAAVCGNCSSLLRNSK